MSNKFIKFLAAFSEKVSLKHAQEAHLLLMELNGANLLLEFPTPNSIYCEPDELLAKISDLKNQGRLRNANPELITETIGLIRDVAALKSNADKLEARVGQATEEAIERIKLLYKLANLKELSPSILQLSVLPAEIKHDLEGLREDGMFAEVKIEDFNTVIDSINNIIDLMEEVKANSKVLSKRYIFNKAQRAYESFRQLFAGVNLLMIIPDVKMLAVDHKSVLVSLQELREYNRLNGLSLTQVDISIEVLNKINPLCTWLNLSPHELNDLIAEDYTKEEQDEIKYYAEVFRRKVNGCVLKLTELINKTKVEDLGNPINPHCNIENLCNKITDLFRAFVTELEEDLSTVKDTEEVIDAFLRIVCDRWYRSSIDEDALSTYQDPSLHVNWLYLNHAIFVFINAIIPFRNKVEGNYLVNRMLLANVNNIVNCSKVLNAYIQLQFYGTLKQFADFRKKLKNTLSEKNLTSALVDFVAEYYPCESLESLIVSFNQLSKEYRDVLTALQKTDYTERILSAPSNDSTSYTDNDSQQDESTEVESIMSTQQAFNTKDLEAMAPQIAKETNNEDSLVFPNAASDLVETANLNADDIVELYPNNSKVSNDDDTSYDESNGSIIKSESEKPSNPTIDFLRNRMPQRKSVEVLLEPATTSSDIFSSVSLTTVKKNIESSNEKLQRASAAFIKSVSYLINKVKNTKEKAGALVEIKGQRKLNQLALLNFVEKNKTDRKGLNVYKEIEIEAVKHHKKKKKVLRKQVISNSISSTHHPKSNVQSFLSDEDFQNIEVKIQNNEKERLLKEKKEERELIESTSVNGNMLMRIQLINTQSNPLLPTLPKILVDPDSKDFQKKRPHTSRESKKAPSYIGSSSRSIDALDMADQPNEAAIPSEKSQAQGMPLGLFERLENKANSSPNLMLPSPRRNKHNGSASIATSSSSSSPRSPRTTGNKILNFLHFRDPDKEKKEVSKKEESKKRSPRD